MAPPTQTSPCPAPDVTPPPPPQSLLSSGAVVVGAGPAGCLIAALLAQRGVRVQLIERNPLVTLIDASRAYTMGVMDRGCNALRAVPGMFEAVLDASEIFVPWKVIHTTGTELAPSVPMQPLTPGTPARAPSFIRAMRHELASAMVAFLQRDMPGVEIISEATVTDVTPMPDGSFSLTVECTPDLASKSASSTNGVSADASVADKEIRTLSTHFLIAADGRFSRVLSALRMHEDKVTTTSGLRDVFTASPVASIRRRSLLLRSDVHVYLGTDKTQPIILRHSTAIHPSRAVNLAVFALRDDDARRVGGRIASVIAPEEHAVWKCETRDELKGLLKASMPAVDLARVVEDTALDVFLRGAPESYGQSRRVASLAAVNEGAGDGVTCGAVVFIGDCAHSFSPMSGQGVNAGLEDGAVLAAMVDGASRSASPRDVAAAYEVARLDDVRALIRISTYSGVGLVLRPGLRKWCSTNSSKVRNALVRRFPCVFPKKVSIARAVRYSEIERYNWRMERRLWAAGCLAMAMVGVAVRKVLCRRGGREDDE